MAQLSLFNVESLEEKLNTFSHHGLNNDEDLSKLSAEFLELIYSGAHNCVIPKDLQDQMNPAEIVGLYVGARSFKKNGFVINKEKAIYQNMLSSYSPEEIISELIKYSFGYYELRHYNQIASKVFPQAKGMLKERIGIFAETVKGKEALSKFINSLTGSFSYSNAEKNAEDKESPSYYSPNCDGKNKGFYISFILNVT